MKTTANILNLAVASFDSVPRGESDRARATADYTADMLQRTTKPPEWPDRVDYLALERIARELRSEHIASLFAWAKKALATRFAGHSAKRALSR
jgi:hypothetical protein